MVNLFYIYPHTRTGSFGFVTIVHFCFVVLFACFQENKNENPKKGSSRENLHGDGTAGVESMG